VPTWHDVVNRVYEPWDRKRVLLDTASDSIEHLVDRIETLVGDKG
jgi:hypothetical protein